MSGAAVRAGGRIAGVVTRHYPAEGATLTVARLDRALPELPELLPPPEPGGEPSAGDHGRQVADTAPERLHDRDRELADLARSARGNRRTPTGCTCGGRRGHGRGRPDVLPAVARIAPAALFPTGDTVLAFAGRFPPEYQ